VPAWVKRGLAADQGDVLAAHRHELAGHLQTLIERQLGRSLSAGDGAAVLAPQIAREGQFPHTGVRKESDLFEDFDHAVVLPGPTWVGAAASSGTIRAILLLVEEDLLRKTCLRNQPVRGLRSPGIACVVAI
jgi:hypothetical protein